MPELSELDFVFMTEIERYDAFIDLFHASDAGSKAALEALLSTRDPIVPLIVLKYLEDIPERESVSAICRLLENPNPFVARAAMAAYRRNHFPGRSRILNAYILSKAPLACRFAARTLSRAGFMDALPLLLREIGEREGEVLAEMLDALRYLPDRRCLPVVMPLTQSGHEPTRYQAVRILAALQNRGHSVGLDFFVEKTKDESERVRRAALDALQFFSTRRVGDLFLQQALDEGLGEELRTRALRSLAQFPDPRRVEPLVRLYSGLESSSLRLSVEIALRGIPPAQLRGPMLAILRSDGHELRSVAALLAAQLVPEDPGVHSAVLEIWKRASEMEALDLTEALREFGSDEARALLVEAVTRTPLLAAAAAGALGRMRVGPEAARVAALLRYPATTAAAKHAFLAHWARHGPDPELQDELLPWLLENLGHENVNMRYLSLETLVWYPLGARLPAILGLLAIETIPDTVRAAETQLLKSLGRDPRPLLVALAQHPKRGSLLGHLVRLLTMQAWERSLVAETVAMLHRPPLSLLEDSPETFLTVCVRFFKDGSLPFESLWPYLDDRPRLGLFMRLLASNMGASGVNFPPLPVAFLSSRLSGADAELRALLYQVLALDGSGDALETLTELLLKEADPTALSEGAKSLRQALERAGR